MFTPGANSLAKEERLCGKTTISALIEGGRWGSHGHLKYCCLIPGGAPYNRIMVSVPKKFFKRAVKRNLLKRRIREAYRTQKALFEVQGADIMFQYNSPEIAGFAQLREEVAAILTRLSR